MATSGTKARPLPATGEATGESIGEVLAGRYRLVGHLGSGPSTTVYLAEDLTFGRPVAVKLLGACLQTSTSSCRSHAGACGGVGAPSRWGSAAEGRASGAQPPWRSGDSVVVSSSLVEALRIDVQAAAALNHPHIAAVLDWGDEGIPFVVMEHLGGGSLRAVLDRHGPLSQGQVLLVGLQAARALDHAHRRGVVHGCLTPSNLLFDAEGRLCVADFGLARALAAEAVSAPVTDAVQPVGAEVLDASPYSSPEGRVSDSVHGAGTVDTKADVFSLGMILLEALTGSSPSWSAWSEGPIAVAGPLDPVIRWASARDPADRPDAGELAGALLARAPELDRPEPLPLVVPGEIRSGASPLATGASQVRSQVRSAPHEPDPFAPYDFTKEPDADFIDLTGESATGWLEPTPSWRERRTERRTERRLAGSSRHRPPRRWLRSSLICLALLVLAAAFLALRSRSGDGPAPGPAPTPVVPELAGKPFGEAQRVAGEMGWAIARTEERSNAGVPPDHVIAQIPPAGTQLERGGTLQLRVSPAVPLVAVPDLAGKTIDDARTALFFSGLGLGEMKRQSAGDTPADVVLSVEPGTAPQLPKGSAVDLVVSSGPPGTPILDLSGLQQSEATRQLRGLGLTVTVESEASETVPRGRVIRTKPSAGADAQKGATVTLVVSKGAGSSATTTTTKRTTSSTS